LFFYSDLFRIAHFSSELVTTTIWCLEKLNTLNGSDSDFTSGSSADGKSPIAGSIGDEQLCQALEIVRRLCAVLPTYPSTSSTITLEATNSTLKNKRPTTSVTTATIPAGDVIWYAFYHALESTFDNCLASSKAQILMPTNETLKRYFKVLSM